MHTSLEKVRQVCARRGISCAAVVIIEIVDEKEHVPKLKSPKVDLDSTEFLFQKKTEGYPFDSMVGSICLFGGNREEADKTAFHTVSRELSEEIGTEVTKEVVSKMTLFSRYLIQAPESIVSPTMSSEYSFIACIFQSSMKRKMLPVTCAEGRAVCLSPDESQCQRFAWAYDVPFSTYLKARGVGRMNFTPHSPFDVDARSCEEKCTAFELPDDIEIGEWSVME
jgi:hypothetical protein